MIKTKKKGGEEKMSLLNSRWYYYTLKKTKQGQWKLNYSTSAFFHCEKIGVEVEKDAPLHSHTGSLRCGDSHRERVGEKKWINESGDRFLRTTIVYKKVSKGRKDLKCKCGAKMVFKGYPTNLELVKKEGKVVGGLFSMGGRSTQKPTRYFKTRKARENYISRIINSKQYGKS